MRALQVLALGALQALLVASESLAASHLEQLAALCCAPAAGQELRVQALHLAARLVLCRPRQGAALVKGIEAALAAGQPHEPGVCMAQQATASPLDGSIPVDRVQADLGVHAHSAGALGQAATPQSNAGALQVQVAAVTAYGQLLLQDALQVSGSTCKTIACCLLEAPTQVRPPVRGFEAKQALHRCTPLALPRWPPS